MKDETTASFTQAPTSRRLLVVWDGGNLARALPSGATWVIGRGQDCDLRIDHRSVSRKHAVLRVQDSITIEETGSANGTRVRGERLPPGKPVVLAAGDVVEIGAASLILQETSTAGPSSGASDGSMRRLLDLVSRVAPSMLSVHFFGETGVGKEVLSRSLHKQSRRAAGPFVAINCAALPDMLVESELFGHEKGAFTGADRQRRGIIEEASGGTLMLDEVGELPLRIQAKLLRVLESKAVQRLGASSLRPVDIRLVSASNRDLKLMVGTGEFREDLYHRLVAIALFVPPLRERVEEILPLASGFCAAASMDLGRPAPAFSAQAIRWLQTQAWTGNIRELKNRIECAALLCSSGLIDLEHLVPQARTALPEKGGDLRQEWSQLERARILDALAKANNNQSEAARNLGISRRTLVSRLEDYNVPRPRKK